MKINSIRRTGKRMPVYDMTVDNTHNFALDSGVFAHNCELRGIYKPRHPLGLVTHWDYSQQEVRVLAKMAGEENLMKAFADGMDVHRFVASKVWKCEQSEVTGAMRRYAKMSTFSILYRKTVQGFAQDMMNGDLAASQKLFDDFFAAFPGIKNFIDECDANVDKYGAVPTLFGNWLNICNVSLGVNNTHYRHGTNYPIQSSASSLAANAIWELYEELILQGVDCIPVGFTHDSCDMEFDSAKFFTVNDLIEVVAVDRIKDKFGIPVGVDTEFGTTQDNMLEFEETLREGNSRTFHFSGNEKGFDNIREVLGHSFDIEYDISGTEQEYNSMMELFVTRRAFSRYLGQYSTKLKGSIKLTPKELIL